MTEAVFPAVFRFARQVRDHVIFGFEVPAEKATEYLARLGGYPASGESRWVAIARLTNDGVVSSPEPEPTTALAGSHTTEDVSKGSAPAARSPARNPNVTRAIMLCKDKRFQMYLSDTHCIAPTEEDASKFLRDYCGVSSRSQILPDTKAEDLFKRLIWAYEAEDRV